MSVPYRASLAKAADDARDTLLYTLQTIDAEAPWGDYSATKGGYRAIARVYIILKNSAELLKDTRYD
jgi:hypothetical protein